MKPAVVLPDAERVTVDVLVGAGLTNVGVGFSDVTLTGTATRIQVELEASGSDDYPVTERAQVRVVVHAAPGRRSTVKALAGEVLMALYSYPGGPSVAGFVPQSGRSAVSVDPDTRNVMCWVLVRVDLLASLAS